jgi:hypothetical protein
MHALLVLLVLLAPILPQKQKTVLPITGYATYYNPGIMKKVVANRERWGQLPECEDCQGYVAMRWPGDIGREVCVDTGENVHGPYQVADVVADHHRADMIKKNRVVDADYQVFFDQWNFKNTPTIVTIVECE